MDEGRLSARQAADVLGVTLERLRELVVSGDIRAVAPRDGSGVGWISSAEVARWLRATAHRTVERRAS